jgi:hypothetical protein
VRIFSEGRLVAAVSAVLCSTQMPGVSVAAAQQPEPARPVAAGSIELPVRDARGDSYGGTRYGSLTTGAVAYDGRPVVFYSFRCVAGITIQVDAQSDFDNVAMIVAPDGRQLAFNDDADEGLNARIRWECPDAGEYLIGVGAYTRSEEGHFTLMVARLGG